MTVERETAGFALPFAAGAASAIYAGTYCGDLIFCIAILCLALPFITIMSPARRSMSPTFLWTLIGLAATGTGCLCGIFAYETAVSDIEGCGLAALAAEAGEAMEKAADGIRFKDIRTNAFIKAVLTGEKAGMPAEVTDAFRESGASHILALSGLHMGVIYMMLNRILSAAGFSPAAVRFKSILTILICGAYTMATGAGPSIVRAFLFIILNETARLTGRYRSTGQTLLTALVIHLCLSPEDIRSVGFQLSYAAMAGIAFIFPFLKNLWPDDTSDRIPAKIITVPTRWIWNSAAMSIACQMTTGPIAYLYFGTFPMHFLLTNLLALPLTGVIIPLGAMTLVLHEAGICPDLLIRLTEWLTGLLIRALEIIAEM